MADDWGQSDQVIGPSYKDEKSLRIMFTPEEQENINRQEAMPYNDVELDAEMKRPEYKNPKMAGALAVLQAEKNKRKDQDTFGENDKEISNWGHNDQIVDEHPIMDAIKGTAGAVGDFLAPVGTAYGGLKGLATLATGGSLDEAVKGIHDASKYNPSHLIMDNPEENKAYNTLNTPLEKLSEFAGEAGGKVTDITGSPVAGTVANVGIQGLAMALGLKGAKSLLSKKGGIETSSKADSNNAGAQAMNELKGTGEGYPTAAEMEKEFDARQGHLDLEPPQSKLYPDQGDLFDSDPGDLRPRMPLSEEPIETIPFESDSIIRGDDPTARADFRSAERSGTRGKGEARPTTNEIKYPGGIDFEVDPSNLGIQLDGLRESAKESGASPQALKAALEGESRSLFEDSHVSEVEKQHEVDAAYAQKEALEREAAANEPRPSVQDRANESLREPTEGSRTVEKMQPPITNRGGSKFIGRKQRGEADIFNDLARGIFKVGDVIRDSLGNKGRIIGSDVNGYRVKTEVEGGAIYSTVPRHDRILRPADEVRLNDGRQGRIRAVNGDQVKVAIERKGGTDLISVPKESVNLMDRSTRNLSKQSGHGEMFKDLAKLLAGGVETLRDSFKKRADADTYKPTYDVQEIKDIVRKGLIESDTLDAFRQKMEMEALPDNVLNGLSDLWQDKDAVIRRAGQSRYSQLSDADKKQADDVYRAYDTLMKDQKFDRDNKPKQDTGIFNRIYNVMNVAKLVNHNKDVGPILKWVMSNTHKIIGDGIDVYKQLSKNLEPYKALSTSEQKHFTDVAIKFDGVNNKMLRDRGLQWASDDMLRQEGFNDAQINAYHELTHGLDKAWDLIEQTFREQGREPPKRIPGYFPHVWSGSYRVLLKNAEGKMVKMYAYSTYWQAKMHEAFGNKEGLKAEIITPDAYPRSHNIVADLVDHLSLDLDRPLDKVIIDKINRSEEFAKRGIVTELLERKANLGGHIAEEGVSAWNPIHNKRLMNMYDKYMEDVSNHYANSRIAKEVWNPFFRDRESGMYSNVPNFAKTVEDFIGRATGRPTNHVPLVDAIARSLMKGVGMPPNGINSFFKAGAQLLYYTKLAAGSPIYVASQILQPIIAARALSRVHTERSIRGAQTGNISSAIGQGLKEYFSWEQGQGTAETRSVMKYLKDKGLVDSHQVDAVDPNNFAKKAIDVGSAGLSKGLERLEVRNRTMSTLMYYRYFRDAGMTQMEAIRAATTQMGLGMGEYARHQSAGMFTDLGTIGHQMRPFSILQNTYLGEAYMNIQLIGDAVKQAKAGKIPAYKVVNSLTPLALMTGTSMFFAGLSGALGYQEYNLAVRLHNWLNPDDPWLEAGAKLRELGVSTPNIYGMLGSLIPGKPNIGPSINMPALNDAGRFPGVEVAAQLGTIVSALNHYRNGEPVNYEALSSSLQRLAPPWAGQWVAEEAAKHFGGNVPSSAASFTKNTIKRTPEQSTVARITGRPNIDEQSQRDIAAINDRMTHLDQQWITEQVHLLTNIMEGFPGPDLKETINKIIAKKRGVGDDIVDKIIKLHEDRMLDTATRQKLTMAGADGARMARLKEIYDLLHGK